MRSSSTARSPSPLIQASRFRGLATTSAEANALTLGGRPCRMACAVTWTQIVRIEPTLSLATRQGRSQTRPQWPHLEMEACVSKPRHGMKVNCTDASLAQAAVTPIAVHLGVFWLTHSEAMPAKEHAREWRRCRRCCRGCGRGRTSFDRSHIVCNGTEVLAAAA